MGLDPSHKRTYGIAHAPSQIEEIISRDQSEAFEKGDCSGLQWDLLIVNLSLFLAAFQHEGTRSIGSLEEALLA